MMMGCYKRVVPRDLFNEARLLKLLGKLIIHIMDNPTTVPWFFEHEGNEFIIHQDSDDGSIFCSNIKFYIANEPIHLFTPLNSRDPWSLYGVYKGEEYCIFSADGKIMPNFGF
jgi:hypothetical protein